MLLKYVLSGVDFKVGQCIVAIATFVPAVTRDGETAGGIGFDDHRGQLVRPDVNLQVVAMKV
jgi:hypothetical protein